MQETYQLNLIKSKNMNLEEKKKWIRENYTLFSWTLNKKVYEQKLDEIKLDYGYLGLFANGKGPGSGKMLFALEESQKNIMFFKRLHILADDVFGGGPTQQVIYDFLEEAINDLFKRLSGNYLRIYFDIKEFSIFEENSLLPNIKKYHPKVARIIKKDIILNKYYISI
ncbi:hypothetical protein [Enterococcus faecalis]